MTAGFGFRKNSMKPESLARFPKRRGIIIWKEDTLHLEIWCPVMWPVVPPKKDVMRDTVSARPGRRYTWIMRKPLSGMGKWNVIKADWKTLLTKRSGNRVKRL